MIEFYIFESIKQTNIFGLISKKTFEFMRKLFVIVSLSDTSFFILRMNFLYNSLAFCF